VNRLGNITPADKQENLNHSDEGFIFSSTTFFASDCFLMGSCSFFAKVPPIGKVRFRPDNERLTF
jgi:hypothetical protein